MRSVRSVSIEPGCALLCNVVGARNCGASLGSVALQDLTSTFSNTPMKTDKTDSQELFHVISPFDSNIYIYN